MMEPSGFVSPAAQGAEQIVLVSGPKETQTWSARAVEAGSGSSRSGVGLECMLRLVFALPFRN
jgi:hypothetical protein